MRSKLAAVLPAGTPDVRVKDMGAVVELLGETISQVRTGTVDPKIANAVGYLSSVLMRALEGSEIVRRQDHQAADIAALKSEVEVMRRNHPRGLKPAGLHPGATLA